MRSSLSRWSVGVVLGTLLLGISGCKGGVTSPTNWLSWGKKPSPTAISGAPRKPSASALPGPRATVQGQTELASNSPRDFGTQGYPTGTGNLPAGYDNGPYGMASQTTAGTQLSTSPYTYGNATGSPYASNGAGLAPPYGTSSTQPAGYAGLDNSYRTADSRAATPASYDPSANAYSGQPAPYRQAQGNYTPPATHNWGTPPAATFPTDGQTAGLSTVAGSFQPGSTTTGPLPGVANLPSGPATHPGSIAPTGFGSGADSGYQAPAGLQPATPTGGYPPATGAGAYPATGAGAYPVTGAGAYPATGAGAYPATGAGAYPATAAGQGYTSPYAKSGF